MFLTYFATVDIREAINTREVAKVEQLIDNLKDAEPGDACGGDDFMPLLLVFNPDARKVYSERVARLVSLGASAVPALVRHISDQRMTKTDLECGMYAPPRDTPSGPNWTQRRFFEYDPKVPIFDWSRVSGLPLQIPAPRITETHVYHARVGDFCFGILGEIVNRNYGWIGGTYRVFGDDALPWALANSTALSPVLADLVRRDWQYMDAKTLKASLESDLWKSRDFSRRQGALERLLYYYPTEAREQVRKLVARPFVSWAVAQGMAFELMQTQQDTVATGLYARFRKRHSKAQAQYVADLIVGYAFTMSVDHPPRYVQRAPRLLELLFPHYDPNHPFEPYVNTSEGAAEYVWALTAFHYKWLRPLILSLFNSCVRYTGSQDAESVDELAVKCCQALHGFRASSSPAVYLRRRVQKLKQTDPAYATYLANALDGKFQP